MRTTISQVASFNRPVQLLLVNQLTINIGFYMLMPYLAGYLSAELAMAAWMVGLVLGMRNLSQQGMFLLGGSLADRIGYKPMILAGLGLRVVGFAMLGLVDSLPGLIVASALTGLAGALFNPAVRAYLAAEAGERKVEAFALFNVFYQTGILVGPLIGLALTAVDFRLTCLVAAFVFLVLTVLQWRSLPARAGSPSGDSVLADWRLILSNRRFVLFALAMTGSYVLSFQVYLALPLASGSAVLTAALFAVSGVLAVAGQLRVTAWARARLGPDRSLVLGMAVLGLAFLPAIHGGWAGLVLCAALLALGTMVVFPFEMDKIVSLSGDRLVATHYGLYNTVVGVGILLGNLLTGVGFDAAARAGVPWAPWLVLTTVGLGCAWALKNLAARVDSEVAGSTS
jgi:predicted MFS family arabinose efflux permease